MSKFITRSWFFLEVGSTWINIFLVFHTFRSFPVVVIETELCYCLLLGLLPKIITLISISILPTNYNSRSPILCVTLRSADRRRRKAGGERSPHHHGDAGSDAPHVHPAPAGPGAPPPPSPSSPPW